MFRDTRTKCGTGMSRRNPRTGVCKQRQVRRRFDRRSLHHVHCQRVSNEISCNIYHTRSMDKRRGVQIQRDPVILNGTRHGSEKIRHDSIVYACGSSRYI